MIRNIAHMKGFRSSSIARNSLHLFSKHLAQKPAMAALLSAAACNYSSATTAASSAKKVLKPSAFAQPASIAQAQSREQAGSQEEAKSPTSDVPAEDIHDFQVTKLIHGDTDLHLAITARASAKLAAIAAADNNPRTALKISVESGGCHGFQYNLVLSDVDKELSQHNADEDDELLVFERQELNSTAYVILDDSSLEILQDSKIDYTKELIGSSFKVVDSPYTSTACGCGSSFDFDFDKLEQKKKEKKQQST